MFLRNKFIVNNTILVHIIGKENVRYTIKCNSYRVGGLNCLGLNDLF